MHLLYIKNSLVTGVSFRLVHLSTCVSIITVHVALFLSFGITPISLQTQSRLILNDPGNKGNNCFCYVAITFLT